MFVFIGIFTLLIEEFGKKNHIHVHMCVLSIDQFSYSIFVIYITNFAILKNLLALSNI